MLKAGLVNKSLDVSSQENKKVTLTSSIDWAYNMPKEKSIIVNKPIPSSNYSKRLQSQSQSNLAGKQQLLNIRSMSDFHLDENDLVGLGTSARSNNNANSIGTAKRTPNTNTSKDLLRSESGALDEFGDDDDDDRDQEEEKKVIVSGDKHVMDKMLDSQLIKLAKERHKFIQAYNFQKKMFIKKHIVNKHAPTNLSQVMPLVSNSTINISGDYRQSIFMPDQSSSNKSNINTNKKIKPNETTNSLKQELLNTNSTSTTTTQQTVNTTSTAITITANVVPTIGRTRLSSLALPNMDRRSSMVPLQKALNAKQHQQLTSNWLNSMTSMATAATYDSHRNHNSYHSHQFNNNENKHLISSSNNFNMSGSNGNLNSSMLDDRFSELNYILQPCYVLKEAKDVGKIIDTNEAFRRLDSASQGLKATPVSVTATFVRHTTLSAGPRRETKLKFTQE